MTKLTVHRYAGEEDLSVFFNAPPVMATTTSNHSLDADILDDLMQGFNENMDPEGLNYNPYVVGHITMKGAGYLLVMLVHAGHEEDGRIKPHDGDEYIVFLA